MKRAGAGVAHYHMASNNARDGLRCWRVPLKIAPVFLLFAGLALSVDMPYWIEPRAGGDTELADWALQAWEKASSGELHFVRASSKDSALLRVLWVTGRDGLYGEARTIIVNGQRGAELYVRPEMDGLGPEIEAAARLSLIHI